MLSPAVQLVAGDRDLTPRVTHTATCHIPPRVTRRHVSHPATCHTQLVAGDHELTDDQTELLSNVTDVVRRDRAEIAPRSRRDRAEIAPRSRRDRRVYSERVSAQGPRGPVARPSFWGDCDEIDARSAEVDARSACAALRRPLPSASPLPAFAVALGDCVDALCVRCLLYTSPSPRD